MRRAIRIVAAFYVMDVTTQLVLIRILANRKLATAHNL
jgi:hypothetical protein